MEIKSVRERLEVHDADLTESRFLDAKLLNSSFVNVALQCSSFTNINFSDTTFADVNLTNVAITDSNLAGMTINGVLASDLIQAYESASKAGNPGASVRGAETSFLL
jgi:uncharacterized protein YjbI with pentapeptide repeats